MVGWMQAGWPSGRVGVHGCGAGCPLVETGKAGPVLILVMRRKPAHSGVAFESGTRGKAATGNVVKKELVDYSRALSSVLLRLAAQHQGESQIMMH